MNEYMLLMLQDAPDTEAADDPKRWEQYIAKLRSTGGTVEIRELPRT